MAQKTIQKTNLPEDWQVKKLEDLLIKITSGSRNWKKYYDPKGNALFIRTQDVAKGFLDTKNIEKINPKKDNERERTRVYEGDVLMTITGWIGKTVVVPEKFPEAYVNQSTALIRINRKKVLPKYLHYFFESKFGESQLKDMMIGIGRSSLSLISIKKSEVILPPLETQEKIVKKLDKFFESYNKLKEEKLKSIENKGKILQGVIAALIDNLSNTRDFVLKDVATVNGRIGWKGLKRSEYTEEGPLFLSVKNLGEFGLNFSDVNHISRKRYEESPEIILKKDDILLSKDGTIGRVGFVRNLSSETTVNSSIVVIRPKDPKKILSEFIYRYFQSLKFQRIVESKKTGTCVPHLFQRDIKEFKLSIPPIEEQKKFIGKMNKVEEILKDLYLDKEITKKKLDDLPKAILSKAFKGEL